MLAPRNKLWSTPMEVIERAIELLQLDKVEGKGGEEGEGGDDVSISRHVVWDIGAGDGRFLIRCAETTTARCIGVEIDEERGQQARTAIQEKGFDDEKCRLIIGNALEQDYSEGTAFFLYLVPRGLRIVLPLLRQIPRKLKVVCYMSGFPEVNIEKRKT